MAAAAGRRIGQQPTDIDVRLKPRPRLRKNSQQLASRTPGEGCNENVICIWPSSLHGRFAPICLLHSRSQISAAPVSKGQIRSIPGQYR